MPFVVTNDSSVQLVTLAVESSETIVVEGLQGGIVEVEAISGVLVEDEEITGRLCEVCE